MNMHLPGEEIRTRGLEALRRALGRAGMIRFLQQFDRGSGDYTRERSQLLKDLTIDQLRRRVKPRMRTRRRGA